MAAVSAASGIFCLFAKPPRAGRAKTRLARHVGAPAAAALAEAFLRDTFCALRGLGRPGVVIATPEPDGAFPGVPASVPRWDHGGGDLGARQERVLTRALGESPWAIAVGADSPGVPSAFYRRAARALSSGVEAVIGPSLDGGFYLIGLRRCPPGLFAGLPWSTPDTCAAMLARLREAGLNPLVIDPWFDVDELDDLRRLHRLLRQGRIAAPASARALAAAPVDDTPPAISVIVPALDEEARIAAVIDAVRRDAGLGELIVVDGGSRDGTVAAARATGACEVVRAPRGRAAQLNAGARLATGEVLLFLHADVGLPAEASRHIGDALADPAAVGGAFKTWTTVDAGARSWLGPLIHLADVRSRVTRHPYGDQAPFVRRAVFERLGGFPDQPLMEDLELSRRLARAGRVVRVPASVRVSGRRLAARPIYYAVIWNVFPALYRAGAPTGFLASLYRNVR